jgi:alkylation response protein AidB-like acyl-CoA dehydrogenase
VDFAFSAEQDEFREFLARFLDERWPVAESRRLLESGERASAPVWKQMAAELGLMGLALPEEDGGQGFGFLELGIALEELGRRLAGGPWFATVVLAAEAIREAGSAAFRREHLPQIASGDLLATLVLERATALPDEAQFTASFTSDGSGLCVTARDLFALSGQHADLLLVPARPEGGGELALLAVRGDAGGVTSRPLDPLDPTRPQARIDLDAAPAERASADGDVSAPLTRTLERAAIGLAAEMVGGTSACLEQAVEYAKSRIQFARPIGSFQAVKHKAAEVLLELESARSLAYWSWWVASRDDASDAELREAASLAQSACGDAYLRAARENIQIQGGMGFTWESDAHLFYRRARASAALLGEPARHRVRLAGTLGV